MFHFPQSTWSYMIRIGKSVVCEYDVLCSFQKRKKKHLTWQKHYGELFILFLWKQKTNITSLANNIDNSIDIGYRADEC